MLAFLSYVREDSADVLKLKEELEHHGIECFVDTESITPGEVWKEKIQREIDRCDFFVACFSEHYSQRRETWMNRELEFVLNRDRRERRQVPWIFPVVLSGDMPVLPRNLDAPLQKLNWISLSPDAWYVNFGKLMAAMMPGSNVRGAGLADMARRYTEARPNARIDILQKLRAYLDLPEAIALLEQGLLDPNEGVRQQAVSLMAFTGEEGAKAVARILLKWSSADLSLRWSLIIILKMMREKAACAVPALVQVLSTLLSPSFLSNGVIAENNKSLAINIIELLTEIGEPADAIRDVLMTIKSDIPEIREAIYKAHANFE